MSRVYLPDKNGRISKINFTLPKTQKKKEESNIEVNDIQKDQSTLLITEPPKIRSSYIPLISNMKLPEYAESSLIITQILELILNKSEKIIKENELTKQLPLYNAKSCVWLCEQLCNSWIYPIDQRQPWTEWQEDQEPKQQKQDNRQIQSVRVRPNPTKSKQQLSETENYKDTIGQDLEIILAQPKLYFKVPDSIKGFKRFGSPQRTQQNLNNTFNGQNLNQTQEIGDQKSYSIAYTIKRQNEQNQQGTTFKAPLSPRSKSPRTTRSTTNTTNSSNYSNQIINSNKDRSYVRKIIKRETLVKVINTSLQQYKEDGQISIKYPAQKIKERTDLKYLQKLNTDSYQNVQPLNMQKKLPLPNPVKLINVPHHPLELNYKSDVRSQSPYKNKISTLTNLNQELFLKKDQEEFKKKVFALAKQKKINLNYNVEKTSRKKAQSPDQILENQKNQIYYTQEEKYDTIKDLIQNNKVKLDSLPQINVKKHRFPQNF